MNNYALTCVACGDTSRNSKGGPCVPCRTNGRQPLRDAVLRAVTHAFTIAKTEGRIPTEGDVMAAVREAMQPRVAYVAGFREDLAELLREPGAKVGMFAGPTPELNDLLEIKPPEDPYGYTAYILRTTRSSNPDEKPLVVPVARWRGGRWQMRRKNNNQRRHP